MTLEQRNQLIIEKLKFYTEQRIQEGPDACRRYLMTLGLWNEDGSLKEFDEEEFNESHNPENYVRLGIVNGPVV